jgi:CubicO group peptidase (beta-lactamase class C family)
MRKIIIVIFSLVFSTIAHANDAGIKEFRDWLIKNDQTGYGFFKEVDICKEYKKHSKKWYESRCEAYPQGKKELVTNLDIKFYDGWIPEENVKPNYDTLVYEFFRYNQKAFTVKPTTEKYEVKPSSNPYEFRSSLKEDKYLDKQLEKTALLSYLRFEDGQITVDKMSPKNRFGKFIKEDTRLRGMSVGKTMTSYVAGHAICEGYIGSINSRLNDWPLIENTLYYDQELINLLNMQAGDEKYVWSSEFLIPSNFIGVDGHVNDIKTFAAEFKNSKKGKSEFNYSAFSTQLILNYVLFKTGDDFEKILEKTFKEKAKIKHSVFFYRVPGSSKDRGNANIMFFASRYDYLRIAKAMLDDWQNDTCVGKYLKTIFENRISKDNDKKSKRGDRRQWPFAKGYAGQFQTHYTGIDKDRPVMGMHGYGGQHIVIDFEKSRIVVTNALHENYNYKKIVYDPIKKGE